ncbi:alpha-galactosidase [Salinibacterium amurskyense]|uniref:Alpha-galactosidase n=1 Tax=Salinibacterium amurskyense TaxID=205941 RepID=A0A2M9D5F5_9MICO|nr:alpha-galactosidase [Salinibacterium amurskyense]PJJ80850.1 alpha-galactosidase [Salinibacterium amurskyense]RLQ82900.1 alpha-galactosidase [Salinibacterium amurskyense]GHD82224.1 alpha-galactosidase [Salinibacterium amurskyense]
MTAQNLHHLSAAGVSLVVDTSSGTPHIIHWGEDWGKGMLADLEVLSAETAMAPNGDVSSPSGIWRENARGFYGRPAVRAHRAGADWTHKFELTTVSASDTALHFESEDAAAGIRVTCTFTVAHSGVILVDSTITNSGAEGLQVEEFATWLPLPDTATESIDFSGRWVNERQLFRRDIQPGLWSRDILEGRTSHDSTIMQFAMTDAATFQNGSVWGVGLLWSGNTRHMIERTATGRTEIGAAELLLPGEMILDAGASYRAPTVAAAFASDGFDGVSHRLHEWLRARPGHLGANSPRPLTLNVWEAVYFDHSFDKLSALVDAAAEVGVERFVLDDGWFAGRRDDNAGLGDWVIDTAVWPEGLTPLIDRVQAAGMQFGLWFEGEMVNANSELYRTHPEWIFGADGRIPAEVRNQQVLDLTHPGAYAHVLGQVDAVLSANAVSYIKWDHNRPLVEPSHLGHAAVHEQTLAIYRLFDEIKQRHPHVEIESCASGGARIDLGMAQHADRFWASDCNDALERERIQRNTMFAIPPEMLGTHIGPTRSHTTGRVHTLQFRAAIALFGHAGIEWDITECTPEERAQLASWAQYYKDHRALLHSGRVVRQGDDDAPVHIMGVVAPSQDAAIYSYVQLRDIGSSIPARIRLSGLDPDARYRVTLVEPAGAAPPSARSIPQWCAGAEVTGRALADKGLLAPILFPESAVTIEAKRV